MGEVKSISTPVAQLREAIRKSDMGMGWVLVKLPEDGPLSVMAYDQLSLSDVLAALACGEHIIRENILYEEEEDDSAS